MACVLQAALINDSAERFDRSNDRRTGHGASWTDDEIEVLKANRHLSARSLVPLLPGRSEQSIRTKRQHTGWTRIDDTKWSDIEDRRLKRFAETLCVTRISKQMPGRDYNSVLRRAKILGITLRPWSKPLAMSGDPLIDAVRQRAHEDGISVMALDRELGTGNYFSSDCLSAAKRGQRRRLDNIAKAVEFFGGEITINWKDE